MSPKRIRAAPKLRGAEKWIMAELGSLSSAGSLSTAKLTSRIAKASGRSYHKNSIYLALRSLVSRGDIKVTRHGVEKSYQMAHAGRSAPTVSSPEPISAPPSAVPPSASSDLTWPERVAKDAMLPHKLALGEILVLSVSNGHVLAATNLHGRLVFERHPL